MFLLNILEGVLAYDLVKIRFMKEKEVILNGNINDKSRGIQLIGPGYLQKVIKGVNWLLSPIEEYWLTKQSPICAFDFTSLILYRTANAFGFHWPSLTILGFHCHVPSVFSLASLVALGLHCSPDLHCLPWAFNVRLVRLIACIYPDAQFLLASIWTNRPTWNCTARVVSFANRENQTNLHLYLGENQSSSNIAQV